MPVPRKKLAAVSVLPNGSKLHHVMFPRYDPDHHLLGMLKAAEMTLVDDENISGETVHIESFNVDGSLRGQVDMIRADFNQIKGVMNTRDHVVIHSDRFNAIGTGLCYHLDQNEGYLIGPVLTWIQNPPENDDHTSETTMNTRSSHLRTATCLGISLLTLPLAAVVPPPVSPSELTAIQQEAAPTSSFVRDGAALVKADLTKDTGQAAEAAKMATSFIADAGLPVPDTDPTAPATKPLDTQPAPNDTVITSEGGMYFDDDKGVLVYLKNVHVVDPRFDLTGADELKIFLEKKEPENPPNSSTKPGDKSTTKPASITGDKTVSKSLPKPGDKPADKPNKPADKPADKPAGNAPIGADIGAKFGEVDHIVAHGKVLFHQKQPQPGKEPIDASGAILTYHTKTGQIIISGGYPWVKQGPSYMRAEQPNLSLRILRAGSFVTDPGKWTMFGPVKQETNDPNAQPKTTPPKKTSTPAKPTPSNKPATSNKQAAPNKQTAAKRQD